MAEVSLKQISNRLKDIFTNQGYNDKRQIIFWYDENKEFEQEVEELNLENVKIHRLTPTNQFMTKLLLEREDPSSNYLIYAPFKKPPVEENHLEDIYLYSKSFFADRITSIRLDLGIDESLQRFLEEYRSFFGSEARRKKFKNLNIDNYTKESIEIGLLSALSNIKVASFEEVIRKVLLDDALDDNKYLKEFYKYNLLEAFWKYCEKYYGYESSKANLDEFFNSILLTSALSNIENLPKSLERFILPKKGNVQILIDSIIYNTLYRDKFDVLVKEAERKLNLLDNLKNIPAKNYLNIKTLPIVERLIISWITDKLNNRDLEATLDELIIEEIIDERINLYFGKQLKNIYLMLLYAYKLLHIDKRILKNFDNLYEQFENYTDLEFLNDYNYRKFYEYYDQIENNDLFTDLRQYVENVYVNEYLEPSIINWNRNLEEAVIQNKNLPLQINFYRDNLKSKKEKTVVFISDALRYEIGKELSDKINEHQNFEATIKGQLSTLPSYTSLGMAALLPHEKLEISEDNFRGAIDGSFVDDTISREKALQSRQGKLNSGAIQFDRFKKLNRDEMRSFLKGKEVVYIYHNQIDARGDELKTEDEVFKASKEAIDEIYDQIVRIARSGNTNNFIITSDHGFIYRKDKIADSDKIPLAGINQTNLKKNKRFLISDEPLGLAGTVSVNVDKMLHNQDKRIITVPLNQSIFNVAGGGQNYVHGGSSPQEMILPVITVKSKKGHVATKKARINLHSNINKITNYNTNIEFVQTEPVTDKTKETSYRIYILSENNEIISNEVIFDANNKDTNINNRIKKFRFSLSEKKYDVTKDYYIVIEENTDNGSELLRKKITIDIPFADDYGFGF